MRLPCYLFLILSKQPFPLVLSFLYFVFDHLLGRPQLCNSTAIKLNLKVEQHVNLTFCKNEKIPSKSFEMLNEMSFYKELKRHNKDENITIDAKFVGFYKFRCFDESC